MQTWTPTGSPADVIGQVEQWLDGPEEVALVVETSGSTGRPKRVLLTRAAVLASVEASARRLGATGPWVLALPSTYVAGLQVVVRSLVAGHRPSVHDADGWPDGEGWFCSLVPTQLRRMLDSADDLAALRRAHTVLIGGGPVGALREQAAALGVRAVATYGAAETAGGCVYDGVPLDGVAVALGESGRIRIAGPTLFSGYVDDGDLTREALVDGWYLTSDAGRIDEDGHLQVLGRLDDVIVTGGVNVPGPAVAARLREHPLIAEAEVLGVPDEEWGNRVVAFLVWSRDARFARSSTNGGSLVEEGEERARHETNLREWVAATCPRTWAPRQVVVLDELPLLPNGKPDRIRLRGLA